MVLGWLPIGRLRNSPNSLLITSSARFPLKFANVFTVLYTFHKSSYVANILNRNQRELKKYMRSPI